MAARSTLTSLQNRAAKSEAEFTAAIGELGDVEPEDIGAFFGKMNIPRTLKDSMDDMVDTVDPRELIGNYEPTVTDFAAEAAVGEAFGEFHVRHLRKLQWHASRPDPNGVPNVHRLYRAMVAAICIRLIRVEALMQTKSEMTPVEWGHARALINKSMSDFREATEVVSSRFAESMAGEVSDIEELRAHLAPLKATIESAAESIDQMRVKFETRRQELTVLPVGYPPVTPAPYFAGDILEAATWSRFRTQIHDCVHSMTTVVNNAALAAG